MKKNALFPQLNGFVHGGDYNPDQWFDYPDIFEKDIELMKEAHINCVSLGIFSWATYEPREGEYHFEWLHNVMDRLYENGIYTILATPSGARPAWLDEKYPDAMRVDEYGVRNKHNARHNHCMSSENYRRLVHDMDTMLAERFSSHPGLLMWHLSNEYGGYCYCDACKKKFREYLAERFHNDIHELNEAWWTAFWSHTYTSFDQIEPPYSNGERSVIGLLQEWRRFSTQNATDFMRKEIEALRAVNPSVPVTTNLMAPFNDYDYRVFSKPLDAVSWDSYPRFHNDYETLEDTFLRNAFYHNMMRGLKKDRPFMLMESAPGLVNWTPFNKYKRPGIHKLACMQAVACGSDSVQYFQIRKGRGGYEQFHGALIDHCGTDDTRIFREVKEVGEDLKRIRDIAGTLADNKIALVFDWDNGWSIDEVRAFSDETKKYSETCIGFYKELMRMGLETDIIGPRDDWSGYKAIIAPMLFMVSEQTAKTIRDYVANGGTVLFTYISGCVNENLLCHLGGFPGAGLKEVFGIVSEETDTLYPSDRNRVTAGGNAFEVFDYQELLRVKGAETLYTYTDDYVAGEAAVTRNLFGKGKAYYVGCRMHLRDMRPILAAVAADAGLVPENVPEGVEHHMRYGDGVGYSFWLNIGGKPVKIPGVRGKDLLSAKEIDGNETLEPNGVWIIQQ